MFKGVNGYYQVACNKDQPGETRYDLAQMCVAIKASDASGYITRDGVANYQVQDVDISLAEKFFVKPARLGSFMLYDTGMGYLAKLSAGETFRALSSGSSTEWALSDQNAINFEAGQANIDQRQLLIPYGDNRRLNHDLTLQAEAIEDPHQDSSYQMRPEFFEIAEVDSLECIPHPEAREI